MHYTFSASQLSVFELCMRKWAWTYLDGVEGEPNKWAEFGTVTHAHLQDWLKDRREPPDTPEGRVALAIIPHLPPPQAVDRHDVERGIEFSLADVRFEGFVDLYQHRGPNGVPRVYDHKTSGDPEQWGLKPHEMPDDIQATIYAAWALIRSSAARVELQWTYGVTRGTPRAFPVLASVTGEEIRPRLERTIALAREARLVRESGLRAIDIPYNPTACEHYGGCPFRQLCNLTPQERMRSIMSQAQQKDAFLAELRARKNGQSVSQPVNPQAAAPPPAAPTAGGGDVLARAAARRAAAQAAPQAAPAPAATQQVAEPVVEAAPEPEATAPRGRPRKSAAPSPQDRWSEFAAVALSATVRRQDIDVLDPEMREAAAAIAADLADRMVQALGERG